MNTLGLDCRRNADRCVEITDTARGKVADKRANDNTREVVDCQVTGWGPWSVCDVDCGAGTMSRKRSIKVQPENGGKHCPSLEQRRGCQVSTCHHHPDPAIKGKVGLDRKRTRFSKLPEC
ncbi:hypothetical protein HHI36_021740 [Cryptolaemus montrouzieri]|uniref:Spondin-like TSP1 domain-containing protein n=1 Tax=Cryptolaemus montrouzieri TaxID=559131 RepID=A0ABD2MXN3_9CUCU